MKFYPVQPKLTEFLSVRLLYVHGYITVLLLSIVLRANSIIGNEQGTVKVLYTTTNPNLNKLGDFKKFETQFNCRF